MIVRTARTAAAAGVDRFFAAVAFPSTKRDYERRPTPQERMDQLLAIEAVHKQGLYVAAPEVFFGQAGRAGRWSQTPVRRVPGGRLVDVRWRSGYEPVSRDPTILARCRSPENDWVYARLWLHDDRSRPTVMLLHGYMGGSYAIEERAWPVRWMFERLGLDLAIPVLPYHGPRKRRLERPLYPSSDPRLNVEPLRQGAWDLITLRRVLMDKGAPAVGLMGMSLGGYVSALLSTVDPGFAFCVPIIPLASIPDLAYAGGRLLGTPEQQAQEHAVLERAHVPVSPLGRPLLLRSDAVRVFAGLADRITPMTHAQRIAEHFATDVHLFHGGHLLQLGREEMFREVARMLRGLGLLDPNTAPKSRAARRRRPSRLLTPAEAATFPFRSAG